MNVNTKVIEDIERRRKIYSTPLDVEKYIADGIISRYQNRKTQFIVHCPADEIPEEINARCNTTKSITKKNGANLFIVGLNLRVSKF
ncbi:hypothetical protein CGH76_23140 [Vibrio parahaemolyticus]|nr:hypothetical protein CGH76_23140 [Vibrio parahaemolyticus]